MKNPILVVVLIVIVAVLGVGAYTFSQNSSQADSMMQKNEVSLAKEETSMDKMPATDSSIMEKDSSSGSGEMMMEKMGEGNYVEYSKSALDAAAENRRVLFFYASWCPTCKPTDADLKVNISKIPADVTVVRVNYNDPETDQEEKDLAKKYGVTYQHTFVQIDSDGKEVVKWNGGKTVELL